MRSNFTRRSQEFTSGGQDSCIVSKADPHNILGGPAPKARACFERGGRFQVFVWRDVQGGVWAL